MFRLRTSWRTVVMLTLVLAVLLSACAPAATPTPRPQATTAPPTAVPTEPMPTEIRIGYLLPLSGSLGPLGIEVKQAVEVAVDIINNAHPDINLPLAKDEGLPNFNGAKLTLVYADHQAVPEKSMSEAERLITEEHVVALAGGYTSGSAATASQAAERLGIPYVSDVSSSPSLHKRGFKWFVRVGPHDQEAAGFMIDFLVELKERGVEIGNLATIHENTLFGADASNEANNFAREAGLPVVVNVPYPFGTADMTAEISTLKAANAQVVIAATYVADGILLTKTMKDQDFNPDAFIGQSALQAMSSYLDPMGAMAEYQMAMDAFAVDEGSVKPLVKQVNDMYRAQYGLDLTGENAIPAMGIIVLADAINRAGSLEPGAIMKALKETDIPAEQCFIATDGIAFDPETGQNARGGKLVLQVQNGKPRVVWPFDRATVDVIWPMPKWSER